MALGICTWGYNPGDLGDGSSQWGPGVKSR